MQGLTFSLLSSTAAVAQNGAGGHPPPGCRELEQLCIDDCALLNDKSLAAIAHLTSLRRLSLKGITAVSDAGVEALAAGLRRLSHLALFGASKLTARQVCTDNHEATQGLCIPSPS